MTYKSLWKKDRPLCFDYEMVCEKYDINLDSVTEEATDDKKPQKEPEVLPF